jgi:hypothetical protein
LERSLTRIVFLAMGTWRGHPHSILQQCGKVLRALSEVKSPTRHTCFLWYFLFIFLSSQREGSTLCRVWFIGF